ncbi:MAG: acetyl-CoA carboxylase carboxyltransferase subunit alpha [Planctomycetota bacterium]|nr:acetyl-CoA carboxylase carboxyltransferase subunit alpha [Planctomycetota bacterium]
MADQKNNTGTAKDTPRTGLAFERPIVELERKIVELQNLSEATGMNLNGELKPLQQKLLRLTRDIYENLDPFDVVQIARHPLRPQTSDYIAQMLDEYLELHGDRHFGDDHAITTGFGRIGERRFLLIAHRKGKETKENIACNWGCAHPEGYRKALQKMRLAEKFKLPILTLINTPGAYPGVGAEERGQAWAIAENILAMARLKTPIVCVVIGEGGSGGALGIGVGDRVLMLEHAYYSVISPEGCAAILWKNGERAVEAAAALKLTSRDLQRLGVVDEIVPEPLGGAHRAPDEMVAELKGRVLEAFGSLDGFDTDQLLARRYERIRAYGSLDQQPEAS